MRFAEWFITGRDFVALLIAVVLSLVLILTNEGRQTQMLRAWTFGGFGILLEQMSSFTRYRNLQEENRWLSQRSADLMLQNSELYEALVENQRLRELLAFKNESGQELVPAKVIGRNENSLIHSVFLAAGEEDGLQKDMAVVTSQGLVGKIYAVSKNQATAQLLLDRNFRVGVIVQRSRVNGVVKWLDSGNVILSEVAKRSDVRIGDRVVTSGLSTIFPGGLEVGYIARLDDADPGMFIEIALQPSVDFSKLEEVFVVKTRPGSVDF